MSAKSILLAHGEKLALAIVAGGCGLVIYGTIDDPTIRPLKDQEQIKAINARIVQAFEKHEPPTLREPRNYLDGVLARLTEQVPTSPLMAWTMLPPDKGKGGTAAGEAYLYVYELLPPGIAIDDAVGKLKVTFEPPKPVSPAPGRRISSEADVTWRRTDRAGEVVNRGRHLGVQIQMRIGEGDWRPLPGSGPDGVLPLTALAKPLSLLTPEPWQTHAVRARLVAAVTALKLDGPIERPRASVIVTAGSVSTGAKDDEGILRTADLELPARQGPFLDARLLPAPGPLPAGARLDEGESLFLGPWSPVAEVNATASVRFALVGLSMETDAADATKTRDVGRFLMLRQLEQGDQRRWMAKAVELKFGQGDVLGRLDEKKKVPNPFDAGKIITVDLTTPFVVDRLVKGENRVLYYHIKAKNRPAGGRDRDLEVEVKDGPTEVVVLKNPESGRELVLTKLMRIVPPNKADTVIYPHRAEAYDERDAFERAPSEFRQWGLVPEAPRAVPPDTGPLAELYKQKVAERALDADNYRTDTPYYTLADGRLVWWDTIEHAIKVHDPRGVMKNKQAAPVIEQPRAAAPAPKAGEPAAADPPAEPARPRPRREAPPAAPR